MTEFAKFTDQESKAVQIIIARANRMAKRMDQPLDRFSLRMDLAAVHLHTPINFMGLLSAPDFDFGHDVFGIMRHIDRETGQLMDFFLPRCASNS